MENYLEPHQAHVLISAQVFCFLFSIPSKENEQFRMSNFLIHIYVLKENGEKNGVKKSSLRKLAVLKSEHLKGWYIFFFKKQLR